MFSIRDYNIFIKPEYCLFQRIEIMYTKVPGFWNGKKPKQRKKYPTIFDEDLNCNEGKGKEIIELLELELGKTREELGNIISAL
jgi:hypothetical protein